MPIYFEFSLAIALTLSSLLSTEILAFQDLECTKTNTDTKNICAVATDQCCLSISGNECKKELSHFTANPPAQVQFLPNSLRMDHQKNLLCIKGVSIIKTKTHNNQTLRGIYLEVSIFDTRYIDPIHFSSASFIFTTHVTADVLEEGLFCLEFQIPDDHLSMSSTFFALDMMPLPPAMNRIPVSYWSDKNNQSAFTALYDVIQSKMVLDDCQKWTEQPPEELPKKTNDNSWKIKPDKQTFRSIIFRK